MVMDVRGVVVVVVGAGPTQQVGLLNNGSAVTAVDGAVSYTFLEEVAKLRGVNTILGRSFVIHGDGTATGTLVRVGQCVIGRMAEIGVPGICCVVLWARGAKGRAPAVAFTAQDTVFVSCVCVYDCVIPCCVCVSVCQLTRQCRRRQRAVWSRLRGLPIQSMGL